jgi:ankyrin repeat protein
LNGGDPAKVKALAEAGADLHYRTGHGYDALLDAVHGRDVVGDARLVELVNVLLAVGVALNGESRYGETCLRAVSRYGRFDGVKVLLDAGADRAQLQWSALHEAVALGALADVEDCVDTGALLEAADHLSRTPWLLAVQCGDLAKARLLEERGADVFASGRDGRQALHCAVAARQSPMLRWLLDEGHDAESVDNLEMTPLMTAVERGAAEAVDILLAHGVAVDR